MHPSNKIDSARGNRLWTRAYRRRAEKNCKSGSGRPVTNVTDTHLRRRCFIERSLNRNFKIEFIAPHGRLCLKRKNRANGSCAVGVEKLRVELNLINGNCYPCRQILHPSQILVEQAFIRDKNKTNYAAMQEKNKTKTKKIKKSLGESCAEVGD